MLFWTKYILLKEKEGQSRESTLQLIETKYGQEKLQEIISDLSGLEGTQA